VPVLKKRTLSDPTKQRGSNVMDVMSKVFSCIMNECTFKQFDAHGNEFQFGGTSLVGCQDKNFSLEIL